MEANYIDLPTILIWSFWLGFALLILYLRREDKREGYPLESDRQGVSVQGFPAMPAPKAARVKHPALVANPQAGTPAAGAHVISDTVTTRVVETEDQTIVMEREVIQTDEETIVVDRVEVTDHEDDDKEDV